MKTLVVQGYNMDENPIHPIAFNQFWGPCLDSVKKWASEMGYDYKFYSGPLEEIDYPSLLNTPSSYDRTKGQFWKFQWCDHPEYDHVIWVDADILVWGTPEILKNEWFVAGNRFDWLRHPFYRGELGFNKVYDQPLQEIYDVSANEWRPMPWRRLQLALYWGTGEAMADLNQWAKTRAYDASKRGDIINATAIWARTTQTDYTEEQYLAQWVEDRGDKVEWYTVAESVDFPQNQTFFYTWGGTMPTQKDCFIHFGGPNKLSKYQQFLCWRAYNSYTRT